MMSNVDHLIIGGAMAYPFLKAKGFEVGTSLCSDEDVILAKKILSSPYQSKIVLPVDHLIALSPNESANISEDENIQEGLAGFDIGPKTIILFKEKMTTAKTILWNGPMGFFEKEEFSKGTFEMATSISELSNVFSLIGGGDSVSAVNKSGVASKISHISTGGGATLNFLEEGSLPGIKALQFGL